eukprot:1157443-Pelagomonas_calceolata.AAC.4
MLGLDAHAATKLALKLHAHSVQLRLLLVTLLIPIDFFLVSLGEGDTQCLGPTRHLFAPAELHL